MRKIKDKINGAVNKVSSILGVFTGKCCDMNVMNHNDFRLGRKVFETLMDSEEYKLAMQNRHYLGYLGHPEDSECQDYEHACIVMTDMRLLDNDDVEGDFDLVDTPVGRIVKAFIDAGVKFGISIRGLGDIDSYGDVAPEGFVFRGFDLVTFPAYDDCIPEFQALTASKDLKKQSQYKKICASIDANLSDINSCAALAVIQEQLPKGSDEFNKVQTRIDELTCPDCEMVTDTDTDDCNILEEKLSAVTELYLDAADTIRDLEQKLADCQATNSDLRLECSTLRNKHSKLRKLVANQLDDAAQAASTLQDKYNRSTSRIKHINASLSSTLEELKNTKTELKYTKRELSAAQRDLRAAEREIKATTDSYERKLQRAKQFNQDQVNASVDLKQQLEDIQASYENEVAANTRLKDKISDLRQQNEEDRASIVAADNLNLKYKKKIEASSEAISQKDSTIEDLKAQLNETVIKCNELESEASNLDGKHEELYSRVEAAEEMVSSYQQAYANLYANALGVYLTGLPITSHTTVEELTSMIKAGTSTANIAASPSYYESDEDDEFIADTETEDVFDDVTQYSAGMVTL